LKRAQKGHCPSLPLFLGIKENPGFLNFL